ncbi:MAG: LysR family transcriptional regulator [Hyphomicrobiales bacterium]|nr:LysR family transcriptional regulator [Hyphomicrobiales bacterium]
MASLRALIQSPTALFAFEAAARNLSFTRAAEELNVTQAAVSYNVKQLETALGVRLFHREHRAVRLTGAGARFFADVSLGLSQIHRAAGALVRAAGGGQVTISCSTAFAAYWFVPRMATFRARHPEIDIRIESSDKDVDLVAEGLSLGIRRGTGRWPGCEAARIAREAIRPIASPAHVEAHGLPRGPADLLDRTLLHLEEPFRPTPTWADWFRHFGCERPDDGRGLRLNDYVLLIQAVLAGEGVALGWEHIVGDLVDKGLLVNLIEAPFREEQDFWVVWPVREPLDEATRRVRDWIIGLGEP